MQARRDHCVALLLLGVLSACGTSDLETSLFGSNGSPDAVPPIPGTVRDGISGDITAQVSTTTLAANWHSFLDTQSGIARYEWAIGTHPGAKDVRSWVDVGNTESASTAGLSLIEGEIYYSTIRAWDQAGNLGQAVSSNGVTISSTASTGLPSLSQAAIDLAINARFVRFDEFLSGGAHAHVFNGGEFGKATAAFSGDIRVDQKLLEQIRHLLIAGNGITATGGFQDQKQVGTTGMFLLAKNTPRIWDQLTQGEKEKIANMMYGALVSSSFVSSDHNPFVMTGGAQYGLNGRGNLHRDWNPNFRNGFLGQVMIGAMFFGPGLAQQMLKQHNHSQWVSSLLVKGLPNLFKTYTSTSSDRPTAAQINATLHQDYKYYGKSLSDVMGIYLAVTEFTYNLTVNTGLNGGNGEMGTNGTRGGYMSKNSSLLPNQGKMGMLAEFATIDASGNRSSAHYSHDGWYVNNYLHYLIVAMGYWDDSSRADEVLDRIEIGTADLAFKIDPARGGGYRDFRHGQGFSAYVISDSKGYTISLSIADALRAYHGR